MPTVTLNPFPIYCAFDNAGNPLAGGLVGTYQAGTFVPQATYSDPAGTIANTNPVVLDAAGRANIYFVVGQTYRVRQMDSASNLIWQVDNIQPVATANDIAAIQSAILTMKGTTNWQDPTRFKTIQAPLLFAGGTPGQWDDNVNTNIVQMLTVPYYYASGPITFNYLRRPVTSVTGNVVMSTRSFRFRDGTAGVTIDSGTSANFVPLDQLTHKFQYTIGATAFVIGDTLRVELIRFGADALDTYNSGIVVFDGAWVEYLAYASR